MSMWPGVETEFTWRLSGNSHVSIYELSECHVKDLQNELEYRRNINDQKETTIDIEAIKETIEFIDFCKTWIAKPDTRIIYNIDV